MKKLKSAKTLLKDAKWFDDCKVCQSPINGGDIRFGTERQYVSLKMPPSAQTKTEETAEMLNSMMRFVFEKHSKTLKKEAEEILKTITVETND